MQGNQDEISAVAAFMIGTQVRELREKNRYTLQDLAAKTGLDSQGGDGRDELMARLPSRPRG